MGGYVKSNRTDTAVPTTVVTLTAAVGCVFFMTTGSPDAGNKLIRRPAANTAGSSTFSVVELRAGSAGAAALNTRSANDQAITHRVAAQARVDAYKGRIDADVNDFLERHPQFEAVVREAPAHVESAFGEGATLSTEVFRDPTFGSEQLFLRVHVALTPDEADERQRLLEDEWWLDVYAKSAGLLGLSVEFA